MKIRVFPSHGDTYNSIVIDTDDLDSVGSIYFPSSENYPSLFIDDLISGLIDQN